MDKNLISINQNTKLALAKAKSLLNIANRILEKKDDEWIENLWKWADSYEISKQDLPRNKKDLLKIKSLTLENLHAATIPTEVQYLKQLETLYLHDFLELPDSIINLKNIKTLTLIWYFCENNGTTNIKIIDDWIEELTGSGCEIFIDCDYH